MPNSRQTAAAKIGEKADGGMPHRRRLAQQAGHHHAVHQSDAGAHVRLRALRAARAPSRTAAAARPTRRSPWRAHWPRRSPRRSASGLRRAACRSRPTGWSVAPTMNSSSRPAGEGLARGGAAQHDHLAGEQRAAGLDLGHGAALQPRALEHDGLLRQPFQGRPLGDAHRDIDGAMAAALGGPVDLLGRLGGGDGRRPPAPPRSPS